MARILAISSYVASGHVGLSAMVPALQALGHDVIALPTVLLSNHPGHPHVSGKRTDVALLEDMLSALERNGRLLAIDLVISGYLPSPGHVAFAGDACRLVRRINAGNPASSAVQFICDPVLGDFPKGLYIDPDAAVAIRDDLLPEADLLTPNAFELEWLTGHVVQSVTDAAAAAHWIAAPRCLVTSVPSPSGNEISNVLVTRSRPGTPQIATTQRRAGVPNGTGDLLTAAFAGLESRMRSDGDALPAATRFVAQVIDASLDAPELRLPQSLAALVDLAPLATDGTPKSGSPT